MTRELLLEYICPSDYTDVCVLIGCEHCEVILNELLDEYDKHVIAQYEAEHGNLADTIREIHDCVAREMYCKGIDDIVIKIKECVGMDWEWDFYFIEEIAEKLKKGDKE